MKEKEKTVLQSERAQRCTQAQGIGQCSSNLNLFSPPDHLLPPQRLLPSLTLRYLLVCLNSLC